MGDTSIMGLKPARLFKMQEMEEGTIRIGDVIPAIVERVDCNKGRAYVRISSIVDGFIRLENFSYPSKYAEGSTAMHELGKDVTGYIYKKIIGKVIDIHEDGLVELDRRQVLQDATEALANNLGAIVEATVESVCKYGIFADIGNGVRTLIHVIECSKCRYDPIEKFFTIGQKLPKVKILDFDPESKFFKASIKQAYERQELTAGSVERVRVCSFLAGGAYVEFDPATTGIMDISPEEFWEIEIGSYVWTRIKKNKPQGFKAVFASLD